MVGQHIGFYHPLQMTGYSGSLTTEAVQWMGKKLNILNRLTDWKIWNWVQGIWQWKRECILNYLVRGTVFNLNAAKVC